MKTDHLALLRSGAPLSTRQQISLTLQLSWPAIMAQLATNYHVKQMWIIFR